MHAAKATTERTAFINFKVRPFPYAKIFGNGIAIISDDLEGVGVLSNEPIAAGALENGQNVGRLDGEPLSTHPGRSKALVQVLLELERIDRIDPSKQPQLQRIAGLEVTLARIDVLRHADLDRGASVFIFANEIDRHVPLLAALPEPVEQDLDHLLV